MKRTQIRSLVQEDPLEKEMANPLWYSYLEIQWTEEPDRLQSMGSKRPRDDLVAKHIYIYIQNKTLNHQK